MAIIRVKKSKDYTVVNNSYLRDRNLSLKTIGLMTIMLSLPENWDYTIEGLSVLLKDGRTSIRTSLQELEENKYLIRNRKRDELGKLTSTEYILYEKNDENLKSENPMLENLTLENPTLENRTQLNTNIQSTKEINNKNNKKEKEIFEIIEENFARTIAPLEYDEIKTWEDTELTRYVIKETILKGIHNIKYISRILEDYRLNNITTIQQAKDRNEKKRGNRSNNENKETKKELSKWEKIRKEAREKRKNERERSQ